MGRARRPSFKGCCAMCASGKGRVRGQSDAARMQVRDRRALGQASRVSRHDIPDDQLDEVIEASMFRDYIWRPEPVRRYLRTLLEDDDD